MAIILTTPRLNLRTWDVADIEPLAKINQDPTVMEYFPSTQTNDETKRFVHMCVGLYTKYGFTFFPVELRDSATFIGFVGINVLGFEIPNFIPRSAPVVEIGWRLDSHYWNNGYATEAATEVLRFALETVGLKEVVSFTTVTNLASRRIMEKIGLTHMPENDFDHPKIDSSSPVCRHVLYSTSRGN